MLLAARSHLGDFWCWQMSLHASCAHAHVCVCARFRLRVCARMRAPTRMRAPRNDAYACVCACACSWQRALWHARASERCIPSSAKALNAFLAAGRAGSAASSSSSSSSSSSWLALPASAWEGASEGGRKRAGWRGVIARRAQGGHQEPDPRPVLSRARVRQHERHGHVAQAPHAHRARSGSRCSPARTGPPWSSTGACAHLLLQPLELPSAHALTVQRAGGCVLPLRGNLLEEA
jgi:hypothetical protein